MLASSGFCPDAHFKKMAKIIKLNKQIVWTCGCGHQKYYIHIDTVGPVRNSVGVFNVECCGCGNEAQLEAMTKQISENKTESR